MNLFEFTAKMAYINSLNLVKDLEEELRALSKNIETSSYNLKKYLSIVNNDTEKVFRQFIAFTKCFKKFEEKSSRKLPDFLYGKRSEGATTILEVLTSEPLPKLTYNQYIELFKYMSIDITLPHNYLESEMLQLKYINEVIQDNYNPYCLDYSKIRTNMLYSYLSEYGNSKYKRLLLVLELRQLQYNDKKYTVIEDFINKEFNKILSNDSLEKAKTIVQAATNAVNSSKELLSMIKEKATNV